MMAVAPDGSFAGTIGGGSVEFEALAVCRELLRQRRDGQRTLRFVQEAGSAGTAALHFQYLDGRALPVFRREEFRDILRDSFLRVRILSP